MKAALAPVTTLDTLPIVLTMSEVARIYRISTATIRRKMKMGLFRPQPMDATQPYRWYRDDVASDLQRKRSDGDRPRPARASLPPAPRRRGAK